MAGVFPNETSIYIVAANTDGSALTANDKVVGEIRNFKISGLEQEDDLKNVFGGQISIEKPRTKGEISFDVSVQNTAASTLDRWDALKFPNGLSSDETGIKMVYISHYSNSLLKFLAMNNCRCEVSETTMNADEELMKSVTLRFNAVTPLGTANLRTSTISGTTLVGNSNAFINGVWSSN